MLILLLEVTLDFLDDIIVLIRRGAVLSRRLNGADWFILYLRVASSDIIITDITCTLEALNWSIILYQCPKIIAEIIKKKDKLV